MFHSMDILVDYMQKNVDNIGVFVNYTLLSDYFAAVFASGTAENIQWPNNRASDFFPLDEELYWTVPLPPSTSRISFAFLTLSHSLLLIPLLLFLPHSYLKGYYTSRTQLKGIVREGEAAAHTSEQLYETESEGERENRKREKKETNAHQVRFRTSNSELF